MLFHTGASRRSVRWFEHGGIVILFTAFLLSTSGCERARKDMLEWSYKNSLSKNRTSQLPSLANLTKVKCPENQEAQINRATGASVCVPKRRKDPNTVEEFYPNGRIKSQIFHRGDALKVTHWYSNGRLRAKMRYRNNEKEGPYKSWYENGQLKQSGEYRKSKEHGTFISMDKQGRKTEEGKYLNGKKGGLWVTYHPNQNVRLKATWRDGLLQGNSKQFYQNGNVSDHGAYAANVREGRWIGYYETGGPRYKGSYLFGKKHGLWIEYDQSGGVTSKQWYKKGAPSARSTLAGTVEFSGGDTLGAPPPGLRNDERFKLDSGVNGRRPKRKSSSWESM